VNPLDKVVVCVLCGSNVTGEGVAKDLLSDVRGTLLWLRAVLRRALATLSRGMTSLEAIATSSSERSG